jgi:hypothetical protein
MVFKGKSNKGEYKITIPQNVLIKGGWLEINTAMELSTWMDFTPLPGNVFYLVCV